MAVQAIFCTLVELFNFPSLQLVTTVVSSATNVADVGETDLTLLYIV